MLYLLPLTCAITAVLIFLFVSEASFASKFIVTVLLIGSIALRVFFPHLWLVSLLIQIIVTIGVLLYLKVN